MLEQLDDSTLPNHQDPQWPGVLWASSGWSQAGLCVCLVGSSLTTCLASAPGWGVRHLGVLALCGAPRGRSQTMPLYKATALSS